jgi:hypothetical protein
MITKGLNISIAPGFNPGKRRTKCLRVFGREYEKMKFKYPPKTEKFKT